MLRCVREHEADGFGTIPEGSLWADDSEFVVDASAFEPADKPKPKKAKGSTTTKGDD